MERYQFTDNERAILEVIPTPLAIYQYVEGHVYTLALSDGFLNMFGYEDRAEAYRIMNEDVFYNTHPDDVMRVKDAVRRFITDDERYEVIFRAKKNTGPEQRIAHAIGEHVFTPSGARLAYVSFTDEGAYTEEDETQATSLNRAFNEALHEESILKANYFDYLTGLPTMTSFFELANVAKETIFRDGGQPVLLYMNLGGMKYFNRKHGFAEGDRLLQAFARLLSGIFGSGGCCRLSQDHFGAFSKEEGLEDKLRRLIRECGELNDGNSLLLRIGIYSARMGMVPVSMACDRAKTACDALRNTYESAYKYYDAELSLENDKRQYIIENLDRALRERWVQVYYQPIMRAVNCKICDEEALARWIDPEKGFLSPADFIPYLEESRLIYKLDLYVVERVLEKMKRHGEAGMIVVPHSVNLSRSDFDACDIVEEVRRRVDDAGIDRSMLTVEITESTLGSDFDFMKAQVERFQSLGFPVWMDDYGSGYSSPDVLQSIRFDLIKFDMSFMRKLNESDSAKIILTELMKMATSLDVDTICEGVETEEQVHFLQEIGCSKLQGFYFGKPLPFEAILERNRTGFHFGFENPEESEYFEVLGRVNLYDLTVIASDEANGFQNSFNTIPMGIIEVKGDTSRFVRSNQSYRDFIKRFFSLDLSYLQGAYGKYSDAFMNGVVKICCEQGQRSFFNEKMPDGSVVHSFARRIGTNPVAGTTAVAIAVLSISEPSEGATYADIARALAADYYNIYVVDLDTDRYIEYSSRVGAEELAMERHGDDFFESAKRDTMTRIFEEDREPFLTWFSKERIVEALDQQGVFTTTYRLMDTGKPLYANMKVMRMSPGSNRIIMGISIIDAQMRQKEEYERIQKERDALARMMALSEDYISMYIIDPETGNYIQQLASDAYDTLGLSKVGKDFFRQALIDAERAFHPEDLPAFRRVFNRENVLRAIREHRAFKWEYRLIISDTVTPVSLKIAAYREGSEEKLVAGVKA